MGPQAHFLRSGEMWSIECSNGASSAGREVAVDSHEPPRFDELVSKAVVPVPAPGEPARELALRCDDGCANACAEEVSERLPRAARAARLRVRLVPAKEEARVPVGLLVDERPRHDRPAALERRAEALELLRCQGQLRLKVLELGGTGVGKVLEQPRPAFLGRRHARDLGPADRVEERGDLVRHEEALPPVDGEDEMPASAELAKPRELRRGPLTEAGALARVRLLVARLEQARQRRVGGAGEEAAVAEELLGLVERLEPAVGRE